MSRDHDLCWRKGLDETSQTCVSFLCVFGVSFSKCSGYLKWSKREERTWEPSQAAGGTFWGQMFTTFGFSTTDLYLHNHDGQPAAYSNCAYFYHPLWADPCMETARVSPTSAWSQVWNGDPWSPSEVQWCASIPYFNTAIAWATSVGWQV